MKTVVSALVTLCLASTAVRADDKELILGRWEGEANKLKYGYEFQKDGVVMVAIPAAKPNPKSDIKAGYKWLDASTIEVTVGKTVTKYEVAVTKDELTLTNTAKKTAEKFTRVAK